MRATILSIPFLNINALRFETYKSKTMDDVDYYVRSFSKKELIEWYDITDGIWKPWFEDIEHLVGKEKGKRFKPSQVKIIFTHWGVPPKWKEYRDNQKQKSA